MTLLLSNADWWEWGRRRTVTDHLILSRWRRKRTTPFGGEFKYTDATELKTPAERARPWWKKLRKVKPPLAWVVVDGEQIPSAQIVHSTSGEVKVSPIETKAIIPVFDDRIILAAEQYEQDSATVTKSTVTGYTFDFKSL